ncbi:MAG: hypothetical protein LBK68_04210 [Candidatus Margulisbacteria bacterium]|jgi:hypothetical protein|nr:hypothetical protein [Candidatus Margulisiibacteriota bacterium]
MANNYTDSYDGIATGAPLSAAKMTAALNTKEKVANKVTTINNQSTDAQYPSAKVVYDTLSGTNSDIVHKTSAETITGVKTFGTTTAAAEPLLGVAKTTAVANDGKKFATEAQVYAVSDAANGKQDKIGAGTAKDIVAYSGIAGTFGTLTRTTAISAKKEDTSDDKIPTEKAVAAYVADLILPKGTILAMESMHYYSSADDAFRAKWQICDGTGTTPDLRHKFLRGFQSGDTASGGTDSVTLKTENLPAHSHSGNTNSDGSHSHKLKFNHAAANYTSAMTRTNQLNGQATSYLSGCDSQGQYLWDSADHTSVSSVSTDNSTRKHAFTTGNTGSGTAFDIKPAYYTVIYIMKVA